MTVEQWPYDPEERAKRLDLLDASEETFQAWARKVGLICYTEVPQVYLDAFSSDEGTKGEE